MKTLHTTLVLTLAIVLTACVSAQAVSLVCAEVSAGAAGHTTGGLDNVGQAVIGVMTGSNTRCLAGVIHCFVAQPVIGQPAPIQADPMNNKTLSKKMYNIITLVFDEGISLITGPELSIVPIGGGADLGASFTYATSSTNLSQDTLVARESGAILTNQTWYRVTPAAGFAVQYFALDVCTLIGDADGSGKVLPADLSLIWAYKLEATEARWDIDGSGKVLPADLSLAWAHKLEAMPAKP